MSDTSLSVPGTARLVGVMADPVAQARTPQLLSEAFAEAAVESLCVPMHVVAEKLGAALGAARTVSNVAGFVLTIPHKEQGVGFCDAVSDRVTLAGSVNAIRVEPDGSLLGETFDGRGFVGGLEQAGYAVAGKRVLLVGAGGAAASIAAELLKEGISELFLLNRTPTRAEHLAERLRPAFPDCRIGLAGEPPAPVDLVVNATSVGLRDDDPMPLSAERLDGAEMIAEALVPARQTALGRAAQDAGIAYLDGRAMLQGQLGLLRDFFSA
ncbi:shikimate dehydrogenase family protein [Pseudodonghicola flavimaris]|uniref:shikimate dehydrogenase (NADP(+)) n=1 Tax=Pseudodonghicola flavimaris TaxID=3050036 RepID=A0ABT7F566_9RHOB|nr:shikimate dehydrogenase [Pseudodonghicola flavimaris]MDK3019742.1 shikimate dehydrogenase [Pseudodonghicola flavimaris]